MVIDGKAYLVFDRRELPLPQAINWVLGVCVGFAIFFAITTAIVGSVASLAYMLFGNPWSWSVFLKWGGGFSAFILHSGIVQSIRWFFSTQQDRTKMQMDTIAFVMNEALQGSKFDMPVWTGDAQSSEATVREEIEKHRPADDWQIMHPRGRPTYDGDIIDAEFTEVKDDDSVH